MAFDAMGHVHNAIIISYFAEEKNEFLNDFL